jgi:hypothetical protein
MMRFDGAAIDAFEFIVAISLRDASPRVVGAF